MWNPLKADRTYARCMYEAVEISSVFRVRPREHERATRQPKQIKVERSVLYTARRDSTGNCMKTAARDHPREGMAAVFLRAGKFLE